MPVTPRIAARRSVRSCRAVPRTLLTARERCAFTVPSLNPVEVLINEHDDDDKNEILRAFVLTKARCWSYEQEWRLIHAEPSKLYGYGVGPLTGVYFGAEMPRAHKEIIALVTRGEAVQLHEMRRDTRSFTLHSQTVKYTPPPHEKPGPDEDE